MWNDVNCTCHVADNIVDSLFFLIGGLMTLEQKIKDLEELAKSYRSRYLPYDDIEQEIAWLTDYRNRLRKEIEFRPKELYAIEHIPTGHIIFNARGGCYKHLDEAENKLSRVDGNCRIVTYKMQEGGDTT